MAEEGAPTEALATLGEEVTVGGRHRESPCPGQLG